MSLRLAEARCDPRLCGSCGARTEPIPRTPTTTNSSRQGARTARSNEAAPGRSSWAESPEGAGYGAFAAEPIAEDEFIAEYVGEIITHDEAERRDKRRGQELRGDVASYAFTLLDREGLTIDAAVFGNLTRFINHKEEGNIMAQILYVNGEYRIGFFAITAVGEGQELYFDYGDKFPLSRSAIVKKIRPAATSQKKGLLKAAARVHLAVTFLRWRVGPGRSRRRREAARSSLGIAAFEIGLAGADRGTGSGGATIPRKNLTNTDRTRASDVESSPLSRRKKRRKQLRHDSAPDETLPLRRGSRSDSHISLDGHGGDEVLVAPAGLPRHALTRWRREVAARTWTARYNSHRQETGSG